VGLSVIMVPISIFTCSVLLDLKSYQLWCSGTYEVLINSAFLFEVQNIIKFPHNEFSIKAKIDISFYSVD